MYYVVTQYLHTSPGAHPKCTPQSPSSISPNTPWSPLVTMSVFSRVNSLFLGLCLFSFSFFLPLLICFISQIPYMSEIRQYGLYYQADFAFFDAIVSGTVFLVSSLARFIVSIQKCNWFLRVHLLSCNFAEISLLVMSQVLIFIFQYEIFRYSSSASTLSFPIWMSFLSFPCQTALVRTSSTIMNRSSGSGHSCLVPELNQRKHYHISLLPL